MTFHFADQSCDSFCVAGFIFVVQGSTGVVFCSTS